MTSISSICYQLNVGGNSMATWHCQGLCFYWKGYETCAWFGWKGGINQSFMYKSCPENPWKGSVLCGKSMQNPSGPPITPIPILQMLPIFRGRNHQTKQLSARSIPSFLSQSTFCDMASQQTLSLTDPFLWKYVHILYWYIPKMNR